MKIPLVDLTAQYKNIRWQVRTAIDRVCDSQSFILGPEVSACERAVASFCGAEHAVGVSSGTDALLASMMAIGVAPGDEVITSPFASLATAGAIARTGARPVFSDIEAGSFNLDPEEAKAKIGARTRAIVPVHLFGRCADMDPLLEAARQRGVWIIEDAAQSFGTRDAQGRAAGTIGELGCLSFSPVRNLGAFGDAGMVITGDGKAAARVRALRTLGGRSKYDEERMGGNFRLNALQAAVLRVKLGYLPLWTAARRQNAARYRELLGDAALAPQVKAPEDVPGHAYGRFVIRCSERHRLQSFLQERGIETEVYTSVPLHLRECFRSLGYRRGEFPRAEAAAQEALALPMYPELTLTQQSYVIAQIGEFYRQAGARALRQAS